MSEIKEDGGSAFPFAPMGEARAGQYSGSFGMTLRDWFAGQALAGFLAGKVNATGDDQLAKFCYMSADAMIAERKKS